MLQSCGTILTVASSSTKFDDVYGIENMPSPLEVFSILDVDALCCMVSYLASDLLGSYQALSIVTGIPLSDIGQHINHIVSHTVGS